MKSDTGLYHIYSLAEVLGATVSEIMQMTVEEWNGWLAYFTHKEELRKDG